MLLLFQLPDRNPEIYLFNYKNQKVLLNDCSAFSSAMLHRIDPPSTSAKPQHHCVLVGSKFFFQCALLSRIERKIFRERNSSRDLPHFRVPRWLPARFPFSPIDTRSLRNYFRASACNSALISGRHYESFSHSHIRRIGTDESLSPGCL